MRSLLASYACGCFSTLPRVCAAGALFVALPKRGDGFFAGFFPWRIELMILVLLVPAAIPG